MVRVVISRRLGQEERDSLQFLAFRLIFDPFLDDIAVNIVQRPFAGNDKRTQTYAGLLLHAPVDGLIEPCLGIDGIVRWGLLDLGVAAAYQMTFKNSYYHIDNFYDKFAVMVIAKLVID